MRSNCSTQRRLDSRVCDQENTIIPFGNYFTQATHIKELVTIRGNIYVIPIYQFTPVSGSVYDMFVSRSRLHWASKVTTVKAAPILVLI